MSVDPKNVAVHYGNTSQVVCNKPVLVRWILASNTSGGSLYLKIYDGESTSAPLKLWIEAALKGCSCIHLPVPVYMSSGLYIAVEGSDVRVSIGYEIVS